MALKNLLQAARKRAKDTVKQTLYPAVVDAVDRFIVGREALPSHRATDVWHPSELAGGLCARQIILMRRHNIPSPVWEVDTGLQRIFDIGHAVHQWYQERYLGPAGLLYGKWRCNRCHYVVEGLMPRDSCPHCQWGDGHKLTPKACVDYCGSAASWHTPKEATRVVATIKSQISRNPEEVEERGGCVHCARWGRWEYLELKVRIPSVNIGGHTDGMLVVKPWSKDKPECIFELKTANERRFGAIRFNGVPERTLKQVNIYMHGLGAKRAVVVFVNKNNGEICEFQVEYTPELIEPELNNADLLERCLADDELEVPPRVEECKSTRSSRAKGCPACDHCFAR